MSDNGFIYLVFLVALYLLGVLQGFALWHQEQAAPCIQDPIAVQDQRFLNAMQEQVEVGIQFRSLVRQHELDNLGANPHVTPAQVEAFTREALKLYERKQHE